jgi:solute carrier family 12 (potassium/chloride transporters), member 8
MVAAAVTLIFIWVGQLNTLAPIVTMPFLLTYAAIDYAYFALAQTFNIQEEREERFKQQNLIKKLPNGTSPTYGSIDSPSRFDSSDLDELFPERIRHRSVIREQSISPTSPVPGEDLPTAPVSENGSAAASPDAGSKGLTPQEQQPKKVNIGRKSHSWYSPLCNRWVSFGGVSLFSLR